jgi:ribosome-associated heat shock protein Hsp15
VKSRTIAQAVIETGHVRIDGKRVEKASETVRLGSVIALPLHDRVRVLKVLGLPERRGPAPEARLCYEELGIDAARPPT